MKITKPFNLNKWIVENKHLLVPPVSNKSIYLSSEDYIVMVVGGPNARTDYHYNETEELFYQLAGNIEINIQEEGKKKTLQLGPGDMFLLPAKVPHSPIRSKDSVGLVIERKRKNSNYKDGLLWFCDHCNHLLYEVYFELNNIETDFLAHFKHFNNSKQLRTCKQCNYENAVDKKYIND